MNNYYAEVDGKPAVVTPEHVGFGLAIDLVGKDDSRSLVVAAIKAAETMDFAGFWNAYEDIVRRARIGKLTRRRLRRDHDQPDQPRHDRHQPLRAAADGRARARSSASARWSTRPSSAG